MISHPFEYHAPKKLEDALALLDEHGSDAKLLAGGMSLVPMMTLGLVETDVLISLNHLEELADVREEDGHIRIGALATHGQIAASPIVRSAAPMLAEAASRIGDVQVRNRGTIGGSLAHADPAANYPVAMLALRAHMDVLGAGGTRRVSASDFFVGIMESAVGVGDLLTEVTVPKQEPGAGAAYCELVRVEGTFAIVNASACLSADGRAGRIAIGGVGPTARAGELDGHLQDGCIADAPSFDALVDSLSEEAIGDLNGSVDYKQAMARVYARRAVLRANERRSQT